MKSHNNLLMKLANSSWGADTNSSRVLLPRAFQFAIRIDSIRYVNRFESICFVKNRPFDSLDVMQFFLLIYCIVSAKKIT